MSAVSKAPRVAVMILGLASGAIASAAQQSSPASPMSSAASGPRIVQPLLPRLRSAPRVILRSGALSVTIALPDAQRGFYRSTRFDWSGMITDVTFGTAHFYGPWADGIASDVHDFDDSERGLFVGERNAATGPAEEFANRDGETVPGYNAAPAGGTFIKIGVGRLRKDDLKPYDHFSHYAIVDGGRWTIRHDAHSITFTQRLAADATGFGFEYSKMISLAPGGVMTISHRLRNIGTKPIKTQIYTHNFARFDGAEIGPGVKVDFPFPLTGPASDPGIAAIDGGELRYLRPMKPGDRLQLPPQPGGADKPSGPFRVTGQNGASITMQGDTPLVRTAIWSVRRTVAVEPFVAIDVEPGAEQKWSWKYTYDDGSSHKGGL